MKLIVAGGTGFIGRPLVAALRGAGHEVVTLSRHAGMGGHDQSGDRLAQWDARTPSGAWTEELRGAAAAINLAGANIGEQRWTPERKREILDSRLAATGALVGAMAGLPAEQRPKALVNASGIDYYGDRGEETVTEETPPGNSFLAEVCVQWEAAARRAEPLGVRVVVMRTSVVLGHGAEALQKLALPFKLFAGGPIGSGRQWFSWIHLDDAIGLYRLAVERADAAGPVNLVAPDVRRERDVATEVGNVLHRPSWAPAPAFALKLALGDQADLVLHGRRAEPRQALALGYDFKYPNLHEALVQALG